MKLKEKAVRAAERVNARRQTAARLLRPVAAWISAHAFPLQILLVIIYRLALDYVYLTMLCRLYGYQGYYADVQAPLYGASMLAALAFAPFVVRLQEEPLPSARIVTFLNYIYFIPLTSYCGCGGAGAAWPIGRCCCCFSFNCRY